ncbi:uncharacterized protein LOC111088198 isoform X3 [Limulus polyphemus]|uniref:Uncharacterized protein LOC111088198 isoform X3 n=1 Tax=Limulus polyphemus TaxID=6850 RepID=A0ABM1TBH7_LIMPO|nr:uncharacterized protein LOC111088198 isoform X3 [Limulus polyphemus]
MEAKELSLCREITFPEEGSSPSIFDFKVAKEEKEENYDELTEKIEDTTVRISTKQTGDSPQSGIISRFSESDNEVQDFSKQGAVGVKKEIEPEGGELQQINSELEVLSALVLYPVKDRKLMDGCKTELAYQNELKF